MDAKARLIDDGTLDTVLRCTWCDSAEQRYMYDPGREYDSAPDKEKPGYDEFVAALIADFHCEAGCHGEDQ